MQKQKGFSFLVGIIIIIVVVITAFGGVFAYQYFVTKINNQPQAQSQEQKIVVQEPFIWEGIYDFGEVAPANPSGGSVQSWEYKLSISSADSRWHLELNVDGFQTLLRISATADNVENSLDVVFDSYAPDNGNIGGNFKKGDVLLTLTPVSTGLAIQWKKMQPNMEKSLTGSVFKKVSN